MAELLYPDLDYYLSSANIGALSDLVTVLRGVGSLIMIRLADNDAEWCNLAPKTAVVATQGLTSGTLNALFAGASLEDTDDGGGLVCMQSQRDLTSSGVAYALFWRRLSSSFALNLLKLSTGLGSGISYLSSVTSAEVPALTAELVCLQLAWALSEDLTSMDLMAFAGNATDFSDLAMVLHYVDTASPLTTSVTEGAFALAPSGQPFRLTMDHMSLRGPV